MLYDNRMETPVYKDFKNFGLQQSVLRALEEEGVTCPTEIQGKVIPLASRGGDVIAKAPTGTGKTLAYVLPLLKAADVSSKSVEALILCPTRELAIQIGDVIKSATKYTEGIRTAVLYGGQDIQRQLFLLRKKPQIVVGTVGRVLDHIDRKTVKLNGLKTLVLDECDVMLDMGFIGDIRKIVAKTNTDRQNLVFSATIPDQIKALCSEMMKDPVTVSSECEGRELPDVKQYYILLKDSQRVECLKALVQKYSLKRTIVFCNTKFRAEKLAQAMKSKGITCCLLHGDLDQKERSAAMKAFKEGKYAMLVTTDVSARGIDVEDVDAVINFDPPADEDYYVHRIGRTARAFRKGAAYTLAEAYQLSYIQAYIRRTGVEITPLELEYDYAASYTLPKDGSNKRDAEARARDRENSVRYFLNIGKRDMFDKPTLVRLVCSKAGVSEYKIIDVKIRDTYSFVQVTLDEAEKVPALKGLTVGSRRINVDIASEEAESKEKKEKKPFSKEGAKVGRDRAARENKERCGRGGKSKRADGKKTDNTGSKVNTRKDKEKTRSKKGIVLNKKGQVQNPKPRGKRMKKL